MCSACAFGFVEQIGLCLDEQTLKQALLLFKESKSLLIANVDSIGTGTVRLLILIIRGVFSVLLQIFSRFLPLLVRGSCNVLSENY